MKERIFGNLIGFPQFSYYINAKGKAILQYTLKKVTVVMSRSLVDMY